MYCYAIPEDLRGATSLPWPCWSCQSCALDRLSFPRAVETLRPPPPAQRQSPCYAPSCGEIRAEAVRLLRRKSRDTCPRCPSPRPCSSRGPTSPGPMPPSLLLAPHGSSRGPRQGSTESTAAGRPIVKSSRRGRPLGSSLC